MSRTTCLTILPLLLGLTACQPDPSETRPNIVLIMADDMGYSDIGSYGGEIETPHLDALAASGIAFTQFYNNARCCPTRASLLTGLYPHQAGVGHMMGDDGLDGYRGDLSETSVTIAEALGRDGYRTYMSGKWHVTKHVGHWTGEDDLDSRHNWPRQRGFDRFFGTIHGAGSFYDPAGLVSENEPIEPYEGFYYTTAISDTAIRYVTDHADRTSDEPFFMYVAYTAPHWPTHAPADEIAKYEGRYSEGWDAIRAERRKKMLELGVIENTAVLSDRDPRIPDWESYGDRERAWFERSMEAYAAQIDIMDQGIGQIIQALDATGQKENTLVIFLADNGGCAEELNENWTGLHIPDLSRDGTYKIAVGNNFDILPGPEDSYQSYGKFWANVSNTPFRLYKHWVHEGGIATPFIMNWPDGTSRNPGLTSQYGHIVDIMATAIDAAGATYPELHQENKILPMEGKSLLPLLHDGTLDARPLFWEHEGNRAVREGDWKLVSRYPDDWELYNIARDRSETNNLIQSEPEMAAHLEQLYQSWASRVNVVDWGDLQQQRRAKRGG